MNPTRRCPVRNPSELPNAPTIFVVDGDACVRETLDVVIRSAGWLPRTAASAEEFLACPRVMTPSCLLTEVHLPGLTGLDLQQLISERTEMSIIFMSEHIDVQAAVQAMKAGALEVLTKPLVTEVLLAATRHALERSGEALRREAEMRVLRRGYASLSCRERQVMKFLIQGAMNKQVGAELGISEITVKAHRGNLMRKMEARSLAELVTIAALLGLVPMGSKPRPYVATVRPASPPSSGSERLYPNHLLTDVAYPLVGGIGAFASG